MGPFNSNDNYLVQPQGDNKPSWRHNNNNNNGNCSRRRNSLHVASPSSSSSSNVSSGSASQVSSVFCGFCRMNKELESVYRGHRTKDAANNVTCPQLYKHICELCGATGAQAHTRSYCPVATNLRKMRRDTNSSSQQQNPRGSFNKNNALSGPSEEQDNNSDAPNMDSPLIIDNRMFRNMGRVTNSRYNSAGKLRVGYRRDQQQAQTAHNQLQATTFGH